MSFSQFYIARVDVIDVDKGMFVACLHYKLSWCESNGQVLESLAKAATGSKWHKGDILYVPCLWWFNQIPIVNHVGLTTRTRVPFSYP